MIPTLLGDRRRALIVALLSILGIVLTLRADRTSVARANRLHRADRLDEAAAIYTAHVEQDPDAARLRYNLGTTLLRQGDLGAFDELAAGSDTESERLRVRAEYNLGLWSLIQAIMAPTIDSVRFHAANAIESNKAALRIDPRHDDARWNLALAQLVLETSTPEQGLMDPYDLPGPDDIGERMETPSPLDPANREGLDDATGAESETLAGEDLAPLSPMEADRILGRGHLDPSTLITKMLRRESRSQRQRGYYGDGPLW